MAKSRRNRSHAARRKDPITKPVKPPSDPELAALREAKILPVIKDLQSADPKARSSAASAVSNVIQDSRCRKLLLREQIVHTILTQTLTDAALESRAAGWGILQVLAQEEEADFSIHLYRVDVLTAVEHGCKLVSDKLLSKDSDFQKTPKAEQGFVLSIASSLTSLLTALAEAQDDILEAIAANPAITHLLFLLGSDEFASNPDVAALRSDALACLMILCEDNEQLADKIVSSNNSKCYESLMSLRKETNSDGILACGVLHNLFASLQESDLALGADDSYLIPTLSKAISTFQPGQTQSEATGWANPIECQQLALEILASIGTSINASANAVQPPKAKAPDGDVKEDEEMDDADDAADGADADNDEDDAELDGEGEGEGEGEDEEDDEMDQDELEADMDMVTGADSDDEADDVDDMPVLKAMLTTALPELIRVAAAAPTDDATIRLQGHALAALNNLAWSVSLIDFADAHNAAVRRAWKPAGRALWTQVVAPILASDTADVTLATHITSLAWAVARTLRGTAPIAVDEHRKFMSLYQATRNSAAIAAAADQDPDADPFQTLGVKCVGVLGQLALDPAPVDFNREIATFLITLLLGLPDTPVADAVEALNQLFDIYGDEDYAYDSQVFWKDNLIKHFEAVLPKARAMVKTIDKRAQSELRTRAEEAVLNLNRFIAYKKKHRTA